MKIPLYGRQTGFCDYIFTDNLTQHFHIFALYCCHMAMKVITDYCEHGGQVFCLRRSREPAPLDIELCGPVEI